MVQWEKWCFPTFRERWWIRTCHITGIASSIRAAYFLGSKSVGQTDEGRTLETEIAVRYLWHALLERLQPTACNTVYYATDHQFWDYPPIRYMKRSSQRNSLPFVFVQIEDRFMAELGIKNPVAPPMEVINLDGNTLLQDCHHHRRTNDHPFLSLLFVVIWKWAAAPEPEAY